MYENSIGTTSACAENTASQNCAASPSPNYLRVRGEYLKIDACRKCNQELPPRARRILEPVGHQPFWLGTTSACAENTHHAQRHGVKFWNYLRVRGEYSSTKSSGSSNQELPPRARRILPRPGNALGKKRTTSACAENTPGHMMDMDEFRNYLRVRGEYRSCLVASSITLELPPRARRIRTQARYATRTVGTTSACAENTQKRC